VDLDHHGRSWVDQYPVEKLSENDVVAGRGSVLGIKIRETGVSITYPSETVFYTQGELVKAFVLAG
jgi:hypothetical protein